MKQKLGVLVLVILVVLVLTGLNAVSYVQKQKPRESEAAADRSSFNAGPTGTQAFYTLLSETGRRVTRWERSASELTTTRVRPSVFVVIGPLRQDLKQAETDALFRWVSQGGRLVVIDRHPPTALVTTSANWKLSIPDPFQGAYYTADPADQQEMTANTSAVRPKQPGVLTQQVSAVQPSIFMGSISFEPFAGENEMPSPSPGSDAPPPRDLGTDVPGPSQVAPLSYLSSGDRELMVEVPYGSGHIVYLADPYIVANGGINLVDNAQLGVNLVATDGLIAFDEFHHGYGSSQNTFLQFFAGTPLVAVFLQVVALIAAVFYSQSRRFARPVPEPERDRLSKLEYVSAMAELQQRTRAYDLAVENVYGDLRRRVATYLGLDPINVRTTDLANAVAGRTGLPERDTLQTLVSCEEIVRGEPTNQREVMSLMTKLRQIEAKLGLRRGARRP